MASYYNKMFKINMLSDHNYKEDDYKDFICIGSSKTHTNIPLCWKSKVMIPPITNRCVCTKKIDENCWIMNKDTSEVLAVGNHCVKRFLKKENWKLKRCMGCGDPSLKRKSDFCDKCICEFEEFQKKKMIHEHNLQQVKIKASETNKTLYKFCVDCNKFIYKKGRRFIYCYSCKIKHNN